MDNVNLKKLAQVLGLAVSTVSRALRDSYEISPETKERVLAMAKQLNYQPNPYASSLRKHKSKTIAVVIPEVANSFFSLAIDGIESIAREKGYHVLIYLTHEDVEKETSVVHHLQSGRVDGLLLSLSGSTNTIQHVQTLKEKGIPIIFFDRVIDDLNCSTITTDNYESGFRATEHLIENGCKKIAYLSLSPYLQIANKRRQGYIDALLKNNLKVDEELIIQCGNNKTENERLISELLKRPLPPDGIFASVEKLAIATYAVSNELGINIPDKLKVISFSNLAIASLMNPSLTTITPPAFEIGKSAALKLFKVLENKNGRETIEKIILPSALIARTSTKK